LESQGLPGEIQVSARVRELLKDKFTFVERGMIDIKGKGELLTYLLKGR
jgi:class 3 adenylate cyclase